MFLRIENAYKKLKDNRNVKVYYDNFMSRHPTSKIKTLLSKIDKNIKKEKRKVYINPELAEKEKRMGNKFFKKGDYAMPSNTIQKLLNVTQMTLK